VNSNDTRAEPLTSEAIRRILRGQQPTLSEQFGVSSLALFGSVARGEATPESDIDLLVEFDRPVGLFELFALQDSLEALFGRPVDVGTARGLKERIRPKVLAEAVRVL
jgi:predicted nucleotidyltransferase